MSARKSSRRILPGLGAFIACALFAACSNYDDGPADSGLAPRRARSSDSGVAADGGRLDSGLSNDSGVRDAGLRDGGSAGDSGVVRDGGGADAGLADVGGASADGGGALDGGGVSPNGAPIAVIRTSTTVVPGDLVILDGTQSRDPDGEALTYAWTLASRPATSNASLSASGVATPALRPDVAGSYVVRLRVSDGHVMSAPAEVTVLAALTIPDLLSCGPTDDGVTPTSSPQVLSLVVGPGDDVVPLCHDVVLLGDTAANVIRVLSLSGGELRRYQLTAAPHDLELDRDHGVVYATLRGANQIARVVLESGDTTYLQLTGQPFSLTVGNGGLIFVSSDINNFYDWTITPIEGATGVLRSPTLFTRSFPSLIVYDKLRDQIFAGDTGVSGSTLQRLSVDPGTGAVTIVENVDSGANGQDLAIAPDASRIAYPNGGGNGTGYTIADYDLTDLDIRRGEWNTGAYPTTAAFSPDSRYLVASNRYDLMVFDANLHTRISSVTPTLATCGYMDAVKVAWTLGGGRIVLLVRCGFDRDSGVLFYARP